MKTKKVFYGLAALLFMAYVAINLSITRSYGDNMALAEEEVFEIETVTAVDTGMFECVSRICQSTGGTACSIPGNSCGN